MTLSQHKKIRILMLWESLFQTSRGDSNDKTSIVQAPSIESETVCFNMAETSYNIFNSKV